MSRVTTYLNFEGTTEEAFTYYASLFGTEITGLVRMGDLPAPGGMPDADKQLIAHIELPILAGHVLMATDITSSMGYELKVGNNVTINLEPDTREETERLYAALDSGTDAATGLTDMPWSYWGCTLDKFGVRWMFNCYEGRS
jgi:PhnB protein